MLLRPSPTTRRPAWVAFCLYLGLAACRGNEAAPATADAVSPGGIYAGTLSSSAQGATYNVIGLVGEDGTFELINTSTNGQYGGSLVVTTSATQTGTLRAYDTAGAYATQGPLQVTVTARGNVTGIYSLASGDGGRLGLVYQASYAVPQSLATAAGSYRWTSPRNNGTSTLALSGTGAVTGVTEQGCPFTGTATVPNALYDLFSLTLTYGADGACGAAANTTLTGLATFAPASTAGPATLTVALSSGTTGAFGLFQRQ